MILFGAASVSDPNKGGPELLYALRALAARKECRDVTLLLLGRGELPEKLPFPVIPLGFVGEERRLAACYRAALGSGCAPAGRLLGSGNGLRRNPALQRAVERSFGLPLTLAAVPPFWSLRRNSVRRPAPMPSGILISGAARSSTAPCMKPSSGSGGKPVRERRPRAYPGTNSYSSGTG